MKKFYASIVVIISGLLMTLAVAAQENPSAAQLAAKLGTGFVSRTARVNGTSLHYVRGGNGPAVILIHGFPQDWYEFHKVMPRLAKKFDVIAVDLRGIGGSAVTASGYDSATMAEDIHQLALQLKLERPYLVGHDIGGMAAYALARLYSKEARGALIMDVPLPGVDGWEESIARFWHIGFHQTPDIPEKLVAGRQAEYFRFLFASKSFTDADIAHFAESYAAPDHLRAGFELYRAFPANGRFNAAHREETDIPLVWASGDKSPFAKFASKFAEGLRKLGCRNVKTEVIRNSSHYVANEQPEEVAELIERYA